MVTKSDIVFFLRSHPAIAKINFSFSSFKVYPSAYRMDVADSIDSGKVDLRIKPLPPLVAASYDVLYDQLTISSTFTFASIADQALLVHESTHIYLDILKIGWHSRYTNEAVAYLAEAVFLEAGGHAPRAPKSISAISHTIARSICPGHTQSLRRMSLCCLVLLPPTRTTAHFQGTFPTHLTGTSCIICCDRIVRKGSGRPRGCGLPVHLSDCRYASTSSMTCPWTSVSL
jgi:hypothetical protein